MKVYRDRLSRCIWMALMVVVMLLPALAIDPLKLNSPAGLTTPLSADDGYDWSGTWEGSGQPFGKMTLTQNGNQVTGDLTSISTKYKTFVGTASGNVLTGKIQEAQSGVWRDFTLKVCTGNDKNYCDAVWSFGGGGWYFKRTGAGPGTGNGTTPGTGAALVAESRTADPGGTVQVPIRLDRAGNIGSMNFMLTYNAQVLKVNKVDGGSLVSGALFTPNYKTPPQVRFGLASSGGINGSGTLAYIEFQVIGAAGSSSRLTLSEVDTTDTSGKSVAVTASNGTVTVASGTGLDDIPDYNGDGRVTELDALAALKMSVKLLEEKLKLDVDKNGKVTAEDARLILKKAVSIEIEARDDYNEGFRP